MQNRIEEIILKNLFVSDTFTRKVIPYLEEDYFTDRSERLVYKQIGEYFMKYNECPTHEALSIQLNDLSGHNDEEIKNALTTINQCKQNTEETPHDFLVDETEKWCKDRAIYNAVMESIQIIDKSSSREKGEIPEILKDALSVSFDQHIGHDFIEDSDERFISYNTVEDKLPFDLEMMNKITKGGLPNKTLNVIMAGTGVGKSLFMCHCAANNLMMGKNVLYISMEMSEEKIAERIDANLMNLPIQELSNLPKEMYDKKVKSIRDKTTGKLIVKEYPTASAHTGHFRHLLQELNLKKDFIPDIIYLDYLNICASSRMKAGASVNSYTMVKSIAEELRGLAVEFKLPIMTATQTNRQGFTSTDVGLEDTSESFGLPATADLMVALISTEELEELDQIMVKQLKNRYNDPTYYRRFIIGVDRSRMKLYDTEQSATEELHDSGPAFDNSDSGKRISGEKTDGWDI
ncbi:MAG: DNA primase [Synechococcus sp. CPC35]|nr:DNA primase [Synechococcus sp. CPC35]